MRLSLTPMASARDAFASLGLLRVLYRAGVPAALSCPAWEAVLHADEERVVSAVLRDVQHPGVDADVPPVLGHGGTPSRWRNTGSDRLPWDLQAARSDVAQVREAVRRRVDEDVIRAMLRGEIAGECTPSLRWHDVPSAAHLGTPSKGAQRSYCLHEWLAYRLAPEFRVMPVFGHERERTVLPGWRLNRNDAAKAAVWPVPTVPMTWPELRDALAALRWDRRGIPGVRWFDAAVVPSDTHRRHVAPPTQFYPFGVPRPETCRVDSMLAALDEASDDRCA
jgi:hypothetical protein